MELVPFEIAKKFVPNFVFMHIEQIYKYLKESTNGCT